MATIQNRYNFTLMITLLDSDDAKAPSGRFFAFAKAF
jgi:hypothetical protein